MPTEEGPTLAEILKAIGTHIATNRATLTERDVETTFFDNGFFDKLGYDKPGLDVNQERTLQDGTRPDIITTRNSASVRAVYEFKEPEESLQTHISQLKGYVDQLDADAGVLTNGIQLWLFDGTEGSFHTVFKLSLPAIDSEEGTHTEELAQLERSVNKDAWDLRDQDDVDAYVEETATSPLNLDNEVAQEYFFSTFRFDRHGPFGELIEEGMKLLEALRDADHEFVTGAFEFWRRSYARIPDEDDVPAAWKQYVAPDGTVDDDLLADFMFTLESGFALLSRLFLAKAADDYRFFSERTLRDRLGGLADTDTTIDPITYVDVIDELFTDLQTELIESLFEDDIFLWWADGFGESVSANTQSGNQEQTDVTGGGLDEIRESFATAVAKLLISVLQFDFTQVNNVDLLGGLYQNYFDEETRKALGEFYTPAGVVELILDRAEYTAGSGIGNERLIDPACGSGTFLSDAIERYLEDVRRSANGDPDWQSALEKLCLEPRIVGLDIHPFAVLMAQISITLSILDPYKQAKANDETFTLRRLPVFRTNSLRKESHLPGANLSGEGQQTLAAVAQSPTETAVPIVLPITESNSTDVAEADDPFIETSITLPRYDAIRDIDRPGIGVDTYGDYFKTLLGLLDVVKSHRRNGFNAYTRDGISIEDALQRYLDQPVGGLESFLEGHVNGLLDTLDELGDYDSQGRLLPIFEDVALSLIIKNYLKYDYVIANPPYVEANNIDSGFKSELEDAYPETTTDKYDLYCPFYQRGVERLREGGTLGYITPNQFMVTEYGRGVRSYLTQETTIEELYDFRDSGVFADATNYPVIVIAEKSSESPSDHSIHCARVKRVDEDEIDDDPANENNDSDDVQQWGSLTADVTDDPDDGPVTIDTTLDERVLRRLNETVDTDTYSDLFVDVFSFSKSDLRDEFWAPMPAEEWEIFTGIESSADASLSGFLDLHAGTQTGANDVYLVTPIDVDRIAADETGGTIQAIPKGGGEPVTLERDLLRPWLRGSDVERWRPEWSGEHLIFPYKEVQGSGGVKSVPLDPRELQQFDETWSYLKDNEEKLKDREGGMMANKTHWYAFTAPKSHVDLSRSKVIAAETASETRFALDEDGSWLFKSAYGAPFPPELGDRREYLAAFLNSTVFDFYLKHISSLKSGGHYKYTTSYVGRVPAITDITDAMQDQIRSTVTEITDAIDLRHKTERFPETYIESYSGEIQTIEIEFTNSYSPIERQSIEKNRDYTNELQIHIDDTADIIPSEKISGSDQLADFVIESLVHRSVTAGETVRIPYPADADGQQNLLSSLESDCETVRAVDFDELQATLNAQMYRLFGIDETDQETVEMFLDGYSD